ncbi:MAG: hypothetical protein M9942_00490 [Microthrixaceae bacterium]|nr:hypothetical protein [Microthrixaceae bacterium]
MAELEHRVRGAVDAGHWDEALSMLDSSRTVASTPELLELRAAASYGAGDFEGSVAAWEELHALLSGRGDRTGAARAAAMVAMFLMIDTGLMSPVRGWLRRAETLLGEDPEGGVNAVVAAVRTYERFMCGDFDAAREHSARAVELGTRHGDPAAVVIGRTAAARVMILDGAVDDGVSRLEDIGALLMSGEVDPLTSGMMLCEVVCAAQGLARHDMAAEWTDAMQRWGRGAAFGGLRGRCRVHAAEILRVSGPCSDAEDEALGACDDLRPWMRREFGWPLAELGNIRLRKGDLLGAEEAFTAAHEHVWCPHPGLALVRLAEGRTTEAAGLIDRAIQHPLFVPSKERPPFNDLTLAPLLEARVEIAAAMPDPVVAREAARALAGIAQRFATPWLEASAALAAARAALVSGEADEALVAAREAVGTWAHIGAPYEVARARLVVADALEQLGDASGARSEREAALAGFESYGAQGWADSLRAELGVAHHGDLGGGGQDGAEAHEPGPSGGAGEGCFRLEGGSRTVSFAGRSCVLRDLKGYRYLARMLTEPGREFHVLDLVAVEQGTLPTGSSEFVGPVEPGIAEGLRPGAPGLEVIDDRARKAYRNRLREVEQELADALECNDPARAELAERDRDYLVAELARAVGLGGRKRSLGSDAERARSAVTRTLRYAVSQLGRSNPDLASHLDNALRTGTYCSYRPDRTSAVSWSV